MWRPFDDQVYWTVYLPDVYDNFEDVCDGFDEAHMWASAEDGGMNEPWQSAD